MCFFFGGLKYKEQRFSTLANKVSSCLLFLACIGIIIPTTARIIYGGEVVSSECRAAVAVEGAAAASCGPGAAWPC
jgi:Ca2+/H+ antiporter